MNFIKHFDKQIDDLMEKIFPDKTEQNVNPETIDKIVDELKELWKLHPEWRLAQLVSNACAAGMEANGMSPSGDIFFIPDSVLRQGLARLNKIVPKE